MYNTSKSPIKNVFLTLCLLNNTFNENLFYDKEFHELKQDQDVIDKSLANSKNTMTDLKTLPSLQIPVSWDRGRYPSSILRFLLRNYPHRSTLGFNHQAQTQGFAVRNHGATYAMYRKKLLDYDNELTTITMDTGSNNEIGELNKINNETIVNQKNFFIILPETVKEARRKNYSVALNQVIKGGKGAANKLSDIIKIKLNKTVAKTSTVPGIPQKVLDAIQNTTCPVYVIHEGTTLLVMPKNRAIDKRFTGTTTDKGTTNLNKMMDLIKYEISTIMPSAVSLFENVKNKSEIFVKTKAKKVPTTATKLQTQKVKIPSTSDTLDSRLRATTEKHKEKSPKTTSRSHNLTATILNTLDMLNKNPKQNISVSTKAPKENLNMEMTILDTTCFPVLKIFDNYSSTLKVIMMNHSDDSIAKKTHKPLETKSNTSPNTSLPKTSHTTTLATTLQPTLQVNLTTAPEQSTKCTIIVPCDFITTTKRKTMTTEQDLAVALNELNNEKNYGDTTTTKRNALTTEQDLAAVENECNRDNTTTTKRNALTTQQELAAVENECNCEKNYANTITTKRSTLTTEKDLAALLDKLNCENLCGGTTKVNKWTTEQDLGAVLNREESKENDDNVAKTCIEVKPTTCTAVATKTCRPDEKTSLTVATKTCRPDKKTTLSCCPIKNQTPKESPTKEPDQCKRCNIPRKQRLSTQMFQQNIFSPTHGKHSPTHGKQRNISSLLVIKLISERPDANIEDQVQKVTLPS